MEASLHKRQKSVARQRMKKFVERGRFEIKIRFDSPEESRHDNIRPINHFLRLISSIESEKLSVPRKKSMVEMNFPIVKQTSICISGIERQQKCYEWSM
jgi:hypothetical protein